LLLAEAEDVELDVDELEFVFVLTLLTPVTGVGGGGGGTGFLHCLACPQHTLDKASMSTTVAIFIYPLVK